MTQVVQTASSARAQAGSSGKSPFDVMQIRKDFPGLADDVRGKPLIYLDNAATTQRPRAMVERTAHAYLHLSANVHRGVHTLSARATQAYDDVRAQVACFINAPKAEEIIFTRGATESLNLVSHALGSLVVKAGDEVLITHLEHHANLVPWQLLCEAQKATLVVVPIGDDGQVSSDEVTARMTDRTRIVAMAHMSNALGTVLPVEKVCREARARNIISVIDGAQAVAHLPVDVSALGCDFYAFSAHKMYGPTGVGILWGKMAWLDRMPPWQAGGDMIANVTLTETTFAEVPLKFEAGTPNIAGVLGLGGTLSYLESIDWPKALAYEHALHGYLAEALATLPEVTLIGTAPGYRGVQSFTVEGIHPHDIGTLLDGFGIAVRTGHHCAQPVMQRFDVPATARASLGIYNTREEVDQLVAALKRLIVMFRGEAPS